MTNRILSNVPLFIGLIGLGLLMSSCEDVIDVEIDGQGGDIVVDAWINNLDEPQRIIVQRSQTYFDSLQPPGVLNAQVRVLRSDGEILEFAHEGNGSYVWLPSADRTLGQVGQEFDLEITVDGVMITSSTMMNRVPPIDSLFFEFRENEALSDDGLYAQFFARDPSGLGDAYWIKTYQDSVYKGSPEQLNLAYDAGFDAGTGVDGVIFITPIRESLNNDADGLPAPWEEGQHIRVELHSISTDAFTFFEITREQVTNGNNGIFALPLANTPSNLNASDGGGVLGFFNVAAVSSAEAIAGS